MKKMEIITKGRKDVLFSNQTNFFTEILSQEELDLIKGGAADTKCNKGYSDGWFGVSCLCGYDSEDSQTQTKQ